MPRAETRRDPELHIRFGYDATRDTQMHEYATEFMVFWRDQFGSVHFTSCPDDGPGAWEQWLDARKGEGELAPSHDEFGRLEDDDDG